MNKALAWLKIIRPVNALITFFVVYLTLNALNRVQGFSFQILAAIAAALTGAAGNVINDLFDVRSDAVNHPDRPLVTGAITAGEAAVFYRILLGISTIATFPLGLVPVAIVAGTHLLLFIYSYSLKAIPLAGNLLVSGLTGLAFLYAGVVAGHVQSVLLPALFAFLSNLIREIIKDMEDVAGDRNAAARTLPIKYGMHKARMAVTLMGLLCVISTFVPLVLPVLDIWFFLVACMLVNPLVVYAVKLVWAGGNADLRKASLAMKAAMICGLTGIYFGL